MCGISMILDFDGRARPEHIQQMMGAIKHRGPDDAQHLAKPFGSGQLFLGSNRLKIIDQNNRSNQPFISLDKRYALVFNGEIYNFEALRNELLSSGVQFSTRSDTEVLLYWLAAKGASGVRELNGMFAFIFADFKDQTMLIGRDPFGIKPLFVHHAKSSFIFSSEIQGVLASGLVNKELNNEAIPHYLAYKYAPRPATFFKRIEEVIPGSIWKIDSKGTIQKSQIPKANIEENRPPKELIIDAVVQQYSEVNNTGVMLSGGVDSTLILAILNKELGYRNIPVYSVASTDKKATQDGKFAKKAAKLYQAEYNKIGISQNSLNGLDAYTNSLGQPIADSGGFLTWLVAQKANGKSRVLLSGAGADELFAGYNRHIAFYNYLKFKDKKWFSLLRKGKNLPGLTSKLSQLKKLVNAIHSDPSTTFNNFLQSDTFQTNASLWEPNQSNEQHLRKALAHDQQNYLGADVLAITDQGTMQHSVETRVPYLDMNIAIAANSTPAKELLSKGSKWQLKELLAQYEGNEFAHRKKQGFGLPMQKWLKVDNLWAFNAREQYIHQFIAAQTINAFRKQHLSGKKDLTQELWRILLLHKWLEVNF